VARLVIFVVHKTHKDMKRKKNLLELFAGSRSVGNEAEKQGLNVFSVDWTAYEGIDLNIDIGKLKKSHIPFIPDAVWASPDCTTYSIAGCGYHRKGNQKEGFKPISEYALECDKVNIHWIKLIKSWQKENPKLIFFFENPRGMLRHMEWMKEFKRHTIWYCQYGDTRAKPTDIWTNSKTWTPKEVCKNYRYNKETGGIINKHCHHEGSRRGQNSGTQKMKNSFESSKIPKQLCKEIINSLI